MSLSPSHKIVVIAGGLLHERDISLRSGRRLATHLTHRGHQVEIIDLDNQLIDNLKRIQPDVVWPMIHGSEGELGSLQDLLELTGVNYVGTGPQGCRIASAKPVAKAVVAKNNLPTPDFVTLPQMLFKQIGVIPLLREVEQKLSYPLIVKPARGGSAMGISFVEDFDGLRNAMVNAFAYDDELIVERFITGTEVSVSIVNDGEAPRALPIVEIRTDRGRYDYDARYTSGRTQFFTPAPLDPATSEKVCTLALDCHRVLELEDISRIDILIDNQNQPWFIDANVVPGMTDMSLWPQAAEADDGFEELVNRLTQAVINRKQSAEKTTSV